MLDTLPHHIVLVLNPKAGRGSASQHRAQIEQLLQQELQLLSKPPTWEIWETQSAGHGTDLARKAVSQGVDLVVAAGGDGTLAEVLNGVYGTNATMGLIPLGTGNDCARTLGMGTDIALSIKTLFHGVTERLDIGRTQGHYFMNVAGCGFDAIVAERVNRGIHFLHGMPAYLAGILLSLGRMRPVPMRLTLEDRTEELRAILCSVANTRSYGGGLLIAPDAKMKDGCFDVCIIGDTSRLEFLKAFPTVFKGTHIHHPKVKMVRARYVRVETQEPLPVLVDGEVMGTTPAEFQIVPSAIPFRVPTILP